MAEDNRTTPDGARRRRPAPTIDLTAQDISAIENAAPPPHEPQSQQATQQAPQAPQEPPPRPREQSRAAAAARMPANMGTLLLAGCAGGALVALAFGAYWLALPARETGTASQLAALERQIKSLDAKAEPDELKARIGRLEQSLANPPATDANLRDRVTASENAMQALGIALAALNKRADEAATAAAAARAQAEQNESLRTRLDALEQEKVARDSAAKTEGGDAARLALATLALRDALPAGKPYAAELAVARDRGADPRLLAALEPFAATGLPTDAALAREIVALLPAMIEAQGDGAAHSGGFIERLQANAQKLVRIRPVGEPAGDEPGAVLGRIEVKAARNDIAGVAAEVGKLSPPVRASADAWLRKVAAREGALAAAKTLALESTRALAPR